MIKPFEARGFHARIGPVPFLGLATLSQTGMSFVQQGIVIMGVYFAVQYRLTLAQMGLVTTALSLGIMTSMVMMGAIADRAGPRRLLFVGTGAMTASVLAMLLASRFDVLLVVLYVLGAMLAIVPAAGTKAVFTAFRDRPRGMVMGIRQTGVPIGALLAAALLPRLTANIGLRHVFWLFALELFVVGWLFSRVIPAGASQSQGARVRLQRAVLGGIWRPALVAILMVSGQYLLLGFSLTDLQRIHHVGLASAGLVLAASQLGGGVSRVLTGVISDRLGGHRPPVLAGCALIAALMAWIVALLPRHVPLLILGAIWFVFGMGAVGWNALTMTWAGESVPPAQSGFAMSSVGTAAFMGSAIFPPLFGAFVDATHHFNWGWGLLGVILVAAGFLSWKFGRAAPKDVAPI
ncbi:MAG: MFS transporter [Sulfobacillus acidophilus]|uniref:MFS transporter n=1 Tax=Sulfobacillus acidophilus TaxID=53633 RepID=A0A2T2WK92_9FIRM|nr:MAG: MFS transporter [Sulfobacillus acidophilus]